MATGLAYTTVRSAACGHRHLNNPLPSLFPASFPPSVTSFPHLKPSSLILRTRFVSCLAASPAPPPPPDSDPPSRRKPVRLTGVLGVVRRVQDRAQIFFAVLFWMSLFFWASASDKGGGGRRKKGSRFK